MPEIQQLTFTHKEVAEALVKKEGLHEGLWGIYIEFGLAAANINGPDEGSFMPAAIIPVVKIGIQRFTEANGLTVDASEVNPEPKSGFAPTRRRVGTPSANMGTPR
jgi:hypothetical protein